MCVGIPMRIEAVAGEMATCVAGDRREEVDLALVGAQAVGAHVLVFLGAAREVLNEADALKISRALDALSAAMAGGELGDAFADLEVEPQLPPHLEAARRAGATTA